MTERLPQFHLLLLAKDLAPTQFVKDLGMTFDKNVTLNNHVVLEKIRKHCFFLHVSIRTDKLCETRLQGRFTNNNKLLKMP